MLFVVSLNQIESKIMKSLSYDTCYDCGCDMTAMLNPLDVGNLTIVNNDKIILEVYVSCEGRGCRAGHRPFDERKHVIFS